MRATLDLVWSHMDSPVDGVSECIMHVYKTMLALHVKVTSQCKGITDDTGTGNFHFTDLKLGSQRNSSLTDMC